MVVKRSKSLENIYESLENLLQYFSSIESADTEHRTVSSIESSLLKIESDLRISSNYKPRKRQEA